MAHADLDSIAQHHIDGNARALGNGRDRQSMFPPRSRHVAAEFGQRRFMAEGRTSDTLDLISKVPYIKPYTEICTSIWGLIGRVRIE